MYWIEKLRAELGTMERRLDQREVAEKLKVTQGSTWNWENDRAKPNVNNYFDMARLATAPSTRDFFIVKALNALPSLTTFVAALTPEEKRDFCKMIGIEALLPESWNGQDRRKVVGMRPKRGG